MPSGERPVEEVLRILPTSLRQRVAKGIPLASLTTLRVGGPAEAYLCVHTESELADAVVSAQRSGASWFVLGGGSNLCISDAGIPGLVIHNRARDLELGTETRVASGHGFIRLFLRAACAGLGGLEFAVGIPGSVGGALVSNAGAYRRSIGSLVRELVVAQDGEVRRVEPDWMEFSYRDSRLRRYGEPEECVLSVSLVLTPRPETDIFAEAKEYQRRRIQSQPWHPSAGSFFKNVNDRELAQSLPDLPGELREAGVVPAGYLSAACGCKGLRMGGAQVSERHGNFIVNRGGATARDVRALAQEVRRRVRARFGVTLEEEVIYAGSW